MLDTSNNWIDKLLKDSIGATEKEATAAKASERELIHLLINASKSLKASRTELVFGKVLAAAFDLLVASDYYSSVAHKNWFYCGTHGEPRLYYHFTNCCPRCALQNNFCFNQSSKPGSGNIGRSTSRLLRSFLNALLHEFGRPERVLKGVEPVDTIIVNETDQKLFFGEIKASPLVTLPLSVDSESITVETESGVITETHSRTDNSNLFAKDLSIFLPVKKGDDQWVESYVLIGRPRALKNSDWATDGMIKLLKGDSKFFESYYQFWNQAIFHYFPKVTNSIFWLTNACGAPEPRPTDWPKRRGGDGDGFETISDSKTSVGMDRTDDIKKGIYQVLKLGAEGKQIESTWDFKVGIVSNIHAARHFEEYLKSLKDFVWTIDSTGTAKLVRDLPPDQSVYNLFDGIVTLTTSVFRDKWLAAAFSFLGEG
jgi:hypothetical protein